MVRLDALATGCRLGVIAFGLMAGLSATAARAQAQAPAPAQQGTAVSNQRLFPNDAGMVLNFIKPDKTTDFEAVVAKLKEALQKSDKPERKQQAASWKVFKSPDPAAGGNVLYVFLIVPSVKDADYTVSNILAEVYKPEELNVIYKQYAESYAQGQNIINLNLTSDFSK
jgi:hypothetical protein